MITRASVLIAGVVVIATAGRALAQSESRTMESGSELFTTYCATCHGPDARGHGSLATHLKVPPADLTQIAKRNKGVFDTDLVSRIIDGRQPVKSHGRIEKSEMPVWGDAFGKSSTTEGDQAAVNEKIRALAKYLESIQEKPAR